MTHFLVSLIVSRNRIINIHRGYYSHGVFWAQLDPCVIIFIFFNWIVQQWVHIYFLWTAVHLECSVISTMLSFTQKLMVSTKTCFLAMFFPVGKMYVTSPTQQVVTADLIPLLGWKLPVLYLVSGSTQNTPFCPLGSLHTVPATQDDWLAWPVCWTEQDFIQRKAVS